MHGPIVSLIVAVVCGGIAEWASCRYPPLPLGAQGAVFLAAMVLLWSPTRPYRNTDPRCWGLVGNVILLAWAFVWLLFARIMLRGMGLA